MILCAPLPTFVWGPRAGFISLKISLSFSIDTIILEYIAAS